MVGGPEPFLVGGRTRGHRDPCLMNTITMGGGPPVCS